AVGPWISFIGGPLAVIAIIGWNYEYYRNNFAR
ncbi:cytochrome c oxidase subunit 4, partial [Schumannella luteola]